jgi:hypothetical protein
MKNGADPLNGKTIEQCLKEVHIDIPPSTYLRREFDNIDGRRVNGVPQEILL